MPAGNHFDGRPRHTEHVSQVRNQRFIRSTFYRRRSQSNLECRLRTLSGGSHEPRPTSARAHPNRDRHAFPRFMHRRAPVHAFAPRPPNSAVPMRTTVEPSSMAISKSPDIPIDNSPKSRPGCRADNSSRSFLNSRKQCRAVSGFPSNGGTVISPRTLRFGRLGIRANRSSISRPAGSSPVFAASSLSLISISTGSPRPSFPPHRSGAQPDATNPAYRLPKTTPRPSPICSTADARSDERRFSPRQPSQLHPFTLELLHPVLAEERYPASTASTIADAGCAFDTAISLTSSRARPARLQASPMRSSIAASLSLNVVTLSILSGCTMLSPHQKKTGGSAARPSSDFR